MAWRRHAWYAGNVDLMLVCWYVDRACALCSSVLAPPHAKPSDSDGCLLPFVTTARASSPVRPSVEPERQKEVHGVGDKQRCKEAAAVFPPQERTFAVLDGKPHMESRKPPSTRPPARGQASGHRRPPRTATPRLYVWFSRPRHVISHQSSEIGRRWCLVDVYNFSTPYSSDVFMLMLAARWPHGALAPPGGSDGSANADTDRALS
jgi:hypothetical protein